MSSQTPYENWDRQFSELPVPNDDKAWQHMKKKLEEDERNRRWLPPVFFTCAGWSLALLLLTAAAWWFIRPEKWWQNEEMARQENVKKISPKEKGLPSIQQPADGSGPNTKPNKETVFNSQAKTEVPFPIKQYQYTSRQRAERQISGGGIPGRSASLRNRNDGSPGQQDALKKNLPENTAVKKGLASGEELAMNQKSPDAPTQETWVPPAKQTPVQPAIHKDSAASKTTTAVQKDSAGAKPDSAKAVVKNDTTPRPSKRFIFSAGVGLQQQIPFSGQKAVPYDYDGRKGSLSDYIPSVYLRIERDQKWFVQGEFRFGAPQSLKEFSYSRNTRADTSFSTITTTTLRIKKTYYHQLPLSVNYYIRPNWSVGAGGMYSIFYGAVTEREVKNKNIQSQTESVAKQIVNIKHFNDSFLYKTQLHLVWQTDYHWKRFSMGLRYTRDLQPYIRYTTPFGETREEKSQTLQFILRFRLWQSKK